ncbi:MAG: SBBP repeat-containing protein, partial [candidate division Zixibacteria bacterium]|nr:SBBP repeat-containing protein [candidate division Zixibacteria bacterium]
TIKYYPNGDTAWVRKYNGPGDSSDYACAIAVDDFDNLYVTGRSQGSTTNYDYATIKYYRNGDTAWVRRYNGPGNYRDYALAVAVDGSGNVYVAGTSYDSGTDFDYATIRYYPNGDTAWVRRYNGPGNNNDIALAVAVDGPGNVYVTGYSDGSGTSGWDYATIKYYQPNDPPDPFSLLFPPKKSFTPRVVRFDWEDAVDPNPCDQVAYDLWVSTSYHFPLNPDSTTIDSNLVASEYIKTLDYGTYYWKVKAKDNWGAERWSNQIRYFMVTGIHAGDFNKDGSIDIADVVFLVNYLYTSGPAPEPLELGDVNCDDGVNIGDVIFLINFLFNNGPPPSC